MNNLPDNTSEHQLPANSLANWRRDQKSLVFTNGCFDILHVGHIRYLNQAKALGDILLVGLNSDNSVKSLKGSTRPINNQEERKEMLLALKAVDAVIIFDEETPLTLIKNITPNILVKGGDWPIEKIVGADFILETGGKVLSLPFVPGKSTSGIIDKILSGT